MTAPISPDIAFRLKSVGDPGISPDGSTLIYSMSWIEADTLESRSQIMLMNLSSGRTEEFTSGPKDSGPRFAPDGITMAFLRLGEGQHSQVWVIEADSSEAKQLTDLPLGVKDFSWSPDGKEIVFCADVDPADVDPD